MNVVVRQVIFDPIFHVCQFEKIILQFNKIAAYRKDGKEFSCVKRLSEVQLSQY